MIPLTFFETFLRCYLATQECFVSQRCRKVSAFLQYDTVNF